MLKSCVGDRAMEGRVKFALFVVIVAGSCTKAPPPTFDIWSNKLGAPTQARSRTFEEYVRAANVAEKLFPEYVNRVHFTPGIQKQIVDGLAPTLERLAKQTAEPCEFAFQPLGPFEAPPHQQGWRLIGRALAFRIQTSLLEGRGDQAVRDLLLATRFGFDICSGSATDASLGLTIVDDARRAFLPHLHQLGAEQLERLSAGLKGELDRRRSLSTAIHNEHLNMREAIQFVQDSFRKGEARLLSERLGLDVQDAVQYLDQLRGKSGEEQVAYFSGFGKEADLIREYEMDRADLNARQRDSLKPLSLPEPRPWWRLSKHLFFTFDSLLEARDRTVARTRLLAVEASVLASVKNSGQAPRDLNSLAESLVIDPYTGQKLLYRASGATYRLYSVGANLADDGGDTNEEHAEPDLTLEDFGP